MKRFISLEVVKDTSNQTRPDVVDTESRWRWRRRRLLVNLEVYGWYCQMPWLLVIVVSVVVVAGKYLKTFKFFVVLDFHFQNTKNINGRCKCAPPPTNQSLVFRKWGDFGKIKQNSPLSKKKCQRISIFWGTKLGFLERATLNVANPLFRSKVGGNFVRRFVYGHKLWRKNNKNIFFLFLCIFKCKPLVFRG